MRGERGPGKKRYSYRLSVRERKNRPNVSLDSFCWPGLGNTHCLRMYLLHLLLHPTVALLLHLDPTLDLAVHSIDT